MSDYETILEGLREQRSKATQPRAQKELESAIDSVLIAQGREQ